VSQESEVKSMPSPTASGSFSLSENLLRVVRSVSSNPIPATPAAQAFDQQILSYVRSQG
jgi:hypothetical protein